MQFLFCYQFFQQPSYRKKENLIFLLHFVPLWVMQKLGVQIQSSQALFRVSHETLTTMHSDHVCLRIHILTP